jgi:hypothetical protein
MAESDSGYRVGPGRPPLHTGFKKAVRQPGGRSKSADTILAAVQRGRHALEAIH